MQHGKRRDLIRRTNQSGNQNAVFYFTKNQNKAHFHNFLKGSKLKAKDQNFTFNLKNRYVDRADAWKIQNPMRMNEDQNWPQKSENTINNYEKHRMSLDSFRPKVFSQLASQTHRRSIKDQSKFLISSQSAQIPKTIKNRQTPYFTSNNLQSKSNQYMNMVLLKSEKQQQIKLKRILEDQKQLTGDHKKSNSFMRRMKISINKSKNKSKLASIDTPHILGCRNQADSSSMSKNDASVSWRMCRNSIYMQNKKKQQNVGIAVTCRPSHSHYPNEGELQRSRNPAIRQLIEQVRKWEDDDEQL